MILSLKKLYNLLLYLSLKLGVHLINSQHLILNGTLRSLINTGPDFTSLSSMSFISIVNSD